MTDREAIRRLARYIDFLLQHVPTDVDVYDQRIALKGFYNELQDEPADPTVTREQAEYISRLLDDAWEAPTHAKPSGIVWPRYEKEMPAFFRAVADALEGERAKLSRLREAMTAEADIHDENLRGLGADYCECPFCKMALEGR